MQISRLGDAHDLHTIHPRHIKHHSHMLRYVTAVSEQSLRCLPGVENSAGYVFSCPTALAAFEAFRGSRASELHLNDMTRAMH